MNVLYNCFVDLQAFGSFFQLHLDFNPYIVFVVCVFTRNDNVVRNCCRNIGTVSATSSSSRICRMCNSRARLSDEGDDDVDNVRRWKTSGGTANAEAAQEKNMHKRCSFNQIAHFCAIHCIFGDICVCS